MNDNAPILLFTYKRLKPLQETIKALQKNFLASHSELFIFSDGAKSEKDKEQVAKVRVFLKSITGFRNITIKEAVENKGLATSVKNGVNEMFLKYDKVIVLEDDLKTSSNFLDYMNSTLQKYRHTQKIFSISGYSFPIRFTQDYKHDVYFNRRGCSWGWATWKDRWETIDWDILNKAGDFKQTKILGNDFPSMIKKFHKREIDSWAIPWNYNQFKQERLTVYPVLSKVENNGFDDSATHTNGTFDRFNTVLDAGNKKIFNFTNETIINPVIDKQFSKKFSLYTRLKYRIKKEVYSLFKIV